MTSRLPLIAALGAALFPALAFADDFQGRFDGRQPTTTSRPDPYRSGSYGNNYGGSTYGRGGYDSSRRDSSTYGSSYGRGSYGNGYGSSYGNGYGSSYGHSSARRTATATARRTATVTATTPTVTAREAGTPASSLRRGAGSRTATRTAGCRR